MCWIGMVCPWKRAWVALWSGVSSAVRDGREYPDGKLLLFGGKSSRVVLSHRAQELFLRERLGQVILGADHPAARLVEHAILGGQHDHGHRAEARVALDDRAGLV